jgi:uncharacterized protein (TIGR03066 family)
MRGTLAACAAAVLAVGVAAADDKDKKVDAAKLVGKWELTKSTDENAPKGAMVEFTKDNKVTVTLEFNGKKLELMGTYKVDGDKLTVKMKSPDGKEEEDTDTVKELSDDKMVLIDKNKKETEFAKAKK